MGLEKEEEANFICHVGDLELLRKIVQNRNNGKKKNYRFFQGRATVLSTRPSQGWLNSLWDPAFV